MYWSSGHSISCETRAGDESCARADEWAELVGKKKKKEARGPALQFETATNHAVEMRHPASASERREQMAQFWDCRRRISGRGAQGGGGRSGIGARRGLQPLANVTRGSHTTTTTKTTRHPTPRRLRHASAPSIIAHPTTPQHFTSMANVHGVFACRLARAREESERLRGQEGRGGAHGRQPKIENS